MWSIRVDHRHSLAQVREQVIGHGAEPESALGLCDVLVDDHAGGGHGGLGGDGDGSGTKGGDHLCQRGGGMSDKVGGTGLKIPCPVQTPVHTIFPKSINPHYHATLTTTTDLGQWPGLEIKRREGLPDDSQDLGCGRLCT